MRIGVLSEVGRVRALRVPVAVFACWWVGLTLLALLGGHGVSEAMTRFDGAWYLDVARNGYELVDPSFEVEQNTAFFPGVPWLSRAFLWIGEDVAVVAVSLLLGAASFTGVHLALRGAFGARVATAGVVTLACWPGSVWLWAFYSEGLLVAATSWAAVADRRGNPRACGVFLFTAALSRTVGVVAGPVFALARIWRRRSVDRVAVAYLASSALGLGVVCLAQQVEVGDPLAFQASQGAWGRAVDWPWIPFVDGVDQVLGQLPGVAVEATANLAAVVLVGGAAAVWLAWSVLRRRRDVLLPSWAAAAALVPQFSTAFGSMIRFMTASWPVCGLAGRLLVRLPRAARLAVWTASAAACVVLSRRFMAGVWSG